MTQEWAHDMPLIWDIEIKILPSETVALGGGPDTVEWLFLQASLVFCLFDIQQNTNLGH